MNARVRSFWPYYAAAWLPLVAFYFFAFRLRGDLRVETTVAAAIANVVPDAGLGVLVVNMCRRLWMRPARRSAFAALVPLALAFATFSTWAKATLVMVVVRETGASIDWSSYDRGILLWHAFFSLVAFLVLASVTFALSAGTRLREEETRRATAELLRARSELKALRAQLNPHFLFNTLHTVGALIRTGPDAAEEALVQLGDLLRYALRVQDAAAEGVLLREEWEFVQIYLALEKLRLGDRLCVQSEVAGDVLPLVVPAFVLQPLVENAIRHGIDQRRQGGTVSIRASLDDGALAISVCDDGPGAGGPATPGTGKGLELIRQRVDALYGSAGSVEVRSSPVGYGVTLRLPAALDARWA